MTDGIAQIRVIRCPIQEAVEDQLWQRGQLAGSDQTESANATAQQTSLDSLATALGHLRFGESSQLRSGELDRQLVDLIGGVPGLVVHALDCFFGRAR